MASLLHLICVKPALGQLLCLISDDLSLINHNNTTDLEKNEHIKGFKIKLTSFISCAFLSLSSDKPFLSTNVNATSFAVLRFSCSIVRSLAVRDKTDMRTFLEHPSLLSIQLLQLAQLFALFWTGKKKIDFFLIRPKDILLLTSFLQALIFFLNKMEKAQCLWDEAIKMNSSIDSTNVLAANLKHHGHVDSGLYTNHEKQ